MEDKKDFHVDAHNVINNTDKEIDYDYLIKQFGTQKMSNELIERFEKLTGHKAHIFLKRGIFFSHRDFDKILDYYEQNKPIFLYTGRGPSSDSMHLGHMLPFIFTKWLQDVFNCPLVIQLSDDEKFFYDKEKNQNKKKDLSYFQNLGMENAKDIIACGFKKEKTFIFLNTKYAGYLHENVCKFQNALTYNQCKNIFGLNESDNIGRCSYPAYQACCSFSTSYPHIFGENKDVLCLIPHGIDQDPYFRMTRDICNRIKFKKPCAIHSKFFPALQGFKHKMSSSDTNSAIFLSDTPAQIKKKINKFAFSGGQETAELQRLKGADLEADISINYLNFFMEDTEKYQEIKQKYKKGELLTGEVKKILIEILSNLVVEHQKNKEKVTDEIVKEFMKIRKIE